jgi:hypothetical protein
MGIALMLAVGHNASNGRFREAVAAFTKDRSWPNPAVAVRPLSLGAGDDHQSASATTSYGQ